MKKMGLKKKLLVGVTTGALVVSAAFTYASWDQLTATSNDTTILRNKSTVTTTTELTLTETGNDAFVDEAPSAIGIATFKAENTLLNTAATVTVEAKAYLASDTTFTTPLTGYTILLDTPSTEVPAKTNKDITENVTVTATDMAANLGENIVIKLTATMDEKATT